MKVYFIIVNTLMFAIMGFKTAPKDSLLFLQNNLSVIVVPP